MGAKKTVKKVKKVTKDDVIEFFKNLTILELSDVVKEMEEVFGVTSMPTMTQIPGTPIGGPVEPEGPTAWQVILDGFEDGKKISVIKAIRKEVHGMGLKESKDFVESAPSLIQESCLSEIEANRIKDAVEAEGGHVTIKPVFS